MTSRIARDAAAAWLIDAWGQLHPIGARCAVGRDPQANELVIADLAVSAQHAELRHDGRRWSLRDRGSANGTGLGGQPAARVSEPAHRARVWFGVVGFYLWADPEPPSRDVAPPEVSTVIPDPATFHLTAEGIGELIVRPVRGHQLASAPGELEYRACATGHVQRGPMARLPFQLLRALCDAAAAAADESAACVSSQELLARLPFLTHRPEPAHVRQVVRTLRAALDRVGVPGGGSAGPDALILAGEGLGYRVTWQVRRAGQATR